MVAPEVQRVQNSNRVQKSRSPRVQIFVFAGAMNLASHWRMYISRHMLGHYNQFDNV
jgi:hypothetical protein